MTDTIIWQRIEGALAFAAGIALFITAGASIPWWAAILLFFVPDLSFAGYTMGARIGAFTYNSVHMYGFGAIVMAIGALSGTPLLLALGALWVAHCGFDRMLGYGLKSREGFSITHLGRIGKNK